MCISPIVIENKSYTSKGGRLYNHPLTYPNPWYISVPCNKCYECFLDRCEHVRSRFLLFFNNKPTYFVKDKFGQIKEYFKNSFFFTFTVSNQDMKLFMEFGRLNKSFIKSYIRSFFDLIRKRYGKYKYFICSEFSPIKRRLHFHGILYFENNHDFNIATQRVLVNGKLSKDVVEDYCDIITQLWQFGICSMSPLCVERIFYAFEYITKDVFDLRYVENPKFDKTNYFYSFSRGIGISEIKERYSNKTELLSLLHGDPQYVSICKKPLYSLRNYYLVEFVLKHIDRILVENIFYNKAKNSDAVNLQFNSNPINKQPFYKKSLKEKLEIITYNKIETERQTRLYLHSKKNIINDSEILTNELKNFNYEKNSEFSI